VVNGSWQKEYFYVNGQLLASHDRGPAWVRYYFHDHLGTPRVITDPGGNVLARHDYYPFGQERTPWTDGETHKFTGKERDPESGLDYFAVRYYASSVARFMSVDPLFGSPDDPQSLNRYAYSLNNPLRFVDPTGMQPSQTPEQDRPKEVYAGTCNDFSSTCKYEVPPEPTALGVSEQASGSEPAPATPSAVPSIETLTNVLYNEVAGVRPTSPEGAGSAGQLQEARVAMGHVVINRWAEGLTGGVAPRQLSRAAQEAVRNDPATGAIYQAFRRAAERALGSPDTTGGAKNFILDYPGFRWPGWAGQMEAAKTFGPFLNVAGGGDVPRDAHVHIVILR